jgi:25S rRNA (adenine2142-N1)-methyltransferase
MKRKLKRPILNGGIVKSLKVAKRITAEFHRTVLLSSSKSSKSAAARVSASSGREEGGKGGGKEEEEENKTDSRINRDLYQKASQAALQRTSHVRKFVYSTLTTLNKRPKKGDERKVLNGLEVGAVTTEFCCQSPSWIQFRSIDLNSQHPKIEKRDFFSLKVREDEFDVILNSMVLNCVAEPEDRGEMLLRMAKMLRKETGVLFITIPRRCVENNPFCSTDIFNETLRACGLSIVLTKMSPKIAFWVCEKKAKNVANAAPKPIRRDKKTNNKNSYFSVHFRLRDDDDDDDDDTSSSRSES